MQCPPCTPYHTLRLIRASDIADDIISIRAPIFTQQAHQRGVSKDCLLASRERSKGTRSLEWYAVIGDRLSDLELGFRALVPWESWSHLVDRREETRKARCQIGTRVTPVALSVVSVFHFDRLCLRDEAVCSCVTRVDFAPVQRI